MHADAGADHIHHRADPVVPARRDPVSVAAGGDSLRVRRGAVHHAIRGAVVPQTAETA